MYLLKEKVWIAANLRMAGSSKRHLSLFIVLQAVWNLSEICATMTQPMTAAAAAATATATATSSQANVGSNNVTRAPPSFKMKSNREYVLVAQRRRISRIDLLTDEQELFPMDDLHNVDAIEYDVKNNCVFWAEREYNIIARQCFGGSDRGLDVLVSVDIVDVNSLAYDWMSELLFFIDRGRGTVDVISTADRANTSKTRMHRTILYSADQSEYHGLVVHPAKGLLFWCDCRFRAQTIVRAHLDGTGLRELLRFRGAARPMVISIDYAVGLIYWMDPSRNYIGRCQFDGNDSEKVIINRDSYNMFRAMEVFANHIYWYEWKEHSILRADKEKNAVGTRIRKSLNAFRGMKIISNHMQLGVNACNRGTHNCSHICVGSENSTYTCLCPQGMNVTENGQCYCPTTNGTDMNINWTNSTEQECLTFKRECAEYQFQCHLHGKCISGYV